MSGRAARHVLLAAVLLAVLSACASSPQPRYYSLSPPAATAASKTAETVVVLGPFTVAQYLRRPQIVVRDSSNRLKMAEFDRWAAEPQTALVPWLAREVDGQLTNGVVVAFPSIGQLAAGYRVRGTISQWDSDATSGDTVLVVQWDCVMDEHTVVVPLRTSRYTAQVQHPGDYGEIVRALNQTLADFARDIATALSETLEEHGT